MSTRTNLSPSHLILLAWQTFKRRPWISIGMWIVYALFGGHGGGGGGDQFNSYKDIGLEEWVWIRTILMSMLALVLVTIIVAGPIRGGYDRSMLRLIRGDDSVSFRDLFAGFSKFRKLFMTFLLYSFTVVGGFILLILPGIILLITLWPAFLLVMEDDLNPIEAIKGAWKLTRGYKMEIFVLTLVGITMVIAGVLTLGVGLFVAGPMVNLIRIGAYQEMRIAAEASGHPRQHTR